MVTEKDTITAERLSNLFFPSLSKRLGVFLVSMFSEKVGTGTAVFVTEENVSDKGEDIFGPVEAPVDPRVSADGEYVFNHSSKSLAVAYERYQRTGKYPGRYPFEHIFFTLEDHAAEGRAYAQFLINNFLNHGGAVLSQSRIGSLSEVEKEVRKRMFDDSVEVEQEKKPLAKKLNIC